MWEGGRGYPERIFRGLRKKANMSSLQKVIMKCLGDNSTRWTAGVISLFLFEGQILPRTGFVVAFYEDDIVSDIRNREQSACHREPKK